MTDHANGVTRHAPQTCPICTATIDAAGTFDGDAVAPAPGDWTLCAYCLRWLVYGDELALRAVTDGEWDALTPNEQLVLRGQRERVRRAWGRKL